ncbi:MAG: AAA family ATPase [Gallionella sp.]|nr:AAA family ATPase [Gallionella sp.]
MYLEHFGLNEQPFKITPVTEFFFSGANRKEILDALIYSITEVEGIIKVSGEVGSGKTMLCRMLLEQLPQHIEPIYLANPSLSREEMLYAIADALDLNVEHERIGVMMQNIQNKLEGKAREGKRVVVLVDEAHAMPIDTLEELRLLYNLQVGSFKLLQIVLFGQPELNIKLEQPNMRQLKDRIVHNFNMQPLSRDILENYLMFRMRKAGYHGPNIFSPSAIKLIADASIGLMRRANVLADKSLLAAFVEDTHSIEARHVQAAMRDSELTAKKDYLHNRTLLGGAAVVTVLLLTGAAWQYLRTTISPTASATVAASGIVSTPTLKTTVAASGILPGVAASAVGSPASASAVNAAPATSSVVSAPVIHAAAASIPIAKPQNTAASSRYEQRLEAGKQLLAEHRAVASIQLFYNDAVVPARMEGFLQRAEGLGKLSEIYLLPAQLNGKKGLRVLYGAYPSTEAAQAASKKLPARYQEAFATTIYLLE